LAFLKQIAPDLRRIAVVHVPEIVPNVAFLHVVEAAAPSLGVSVTAAEVRNAADIERVLSALGQEGGGLIVTPSALTATRRDLIIALAARLRLPAIYSFGFYAESGGLMSYGINQLELVRSAASYVDRILRGTSPGDLPVQLPLRYELVTNLKTAARYPNIERIKLFFPKDRSRTQFFTSSKARSSSRSSPSRARKRSLRSEAT
jgi:putative tryptophan/tyrosine transport system substrate-binding protein